MSARDLVLCFVAELAVAAAFVALCLAAAVVTIEVLS